MFLLKVSYRLGHAQLNLGALDGLVPHPSRLKVFTRDSRLHSTLLWLVVGFGLGAVFLGFARLGTRPSELRVLSVGLFVAALLYVVFAVAFGAAKKWVLLEVIGSIFFGVLSWIGVRRAPRLLALAWAAHMIWDTALHLSGAPAEYTPGVYPLLCVSFDLVVAAYIFLAWGTKSHPLPEAGASIRASV